MGQHLVDSLQQLRSVRKCYLPIASVYNCTIMGLSDLVIGLSIFFPGKKNCQSCISCSRITSSNHQALYSSTLRWVGLTAVFIFRKSTFFNVLTKSQAAAENFPFCTIDPNESRVPIPDECYDFLCQFHKPARYGVTSFPYYTHIRSVVTDGLLDISEREQVAMLLTCSCQFCMMSFG